MIGKNTITMNHETMCAALEMYLNNQRLSTAPKLSVVSVDKAGRHMGIEFTVETEATEASK